MLEERLVEAGVTVARTSGDLVRYHDKMMIVDRQELYVLAFNFTYLDMEHSRSFGVVTKSSALVREAVKLFEADTQRLEYAAGLAALVVSPLNARKELSAFIEGAGEELLIYDVEIDDAGMIGRLERRAAAGVEVRIIGRIGGRTERLTARELTAFRLHTRTIVRDRTDAFVGSQSLRELELDRRRELGIVFRDAEAVGRLVQVFEEDWTSATAAPPDTAELTGHA
jgi:phosphatidylserine/phosphatidylglycerophosphate/cardiolipin synthase-like enzyme